ncbi:DUF1330 domain-containing protein [Telmatobacter sp. DSM 110680]|uniref:DUF1330 domain-containing protein n=1 Tax=Telmatobacter sp. DSM 110680 TaxID=3036704 RepID=A0AAU7DH08_9BACT
MKTNSGAVFATMVGVSVSIGAISGIAIRGQQVKTPHGYVIAEADVTDPKALQNYGEKIAETLAPFNHRYIVSTSKIQALEGDPPKSRVVVIEFDSVQKAREWYDSPVYAAIRPIRQMAAKSRIFIVEGVVPQ